MALLTVIVQPLFDSQINETKDLKYLIPSPSANQSTYLLERFLEASFRGRGGPSSTFVDPNNLPPNAPDLGITKSQDGVIRQRGVVQSRNKKESKTRMRILFYVALLWSFQNLVAQRFRNGKGDIDRSFFLQKLKLNGEGGESILDDLIGKFMEVQRGSST